MEFTVSKRGQCTSKMSQGRIWGKAEERQKKTRTQGCSWWIISWPHSSECSRSAPSNSTLSDFCLSISPFSGNGIPMSYIIKNHHVAPTDDKECWRRTPGVTAYTHCQLLHPRRICRPHPTETGTILFHDSGEVNLSGSISSLYFVPLLMPRPLLECINFSKLVKEPTFLCCNIQVNSAQNFNTNNEKMCLVWMCLLSPLTPPRLVAFQDSLFFKNLFVYLT